ncbi:hypothetical protein BCR44DRAFT_330591 [Catenaria anguillulae PL171]|uniref:Uncharacterized protein n=1 Tax=Catenaria anguillulae PL171 TaxID=765915 RepID=A0A1Y2HL79_9FUNG|nr:hypothetical protein BCR44DRAFT_330591 [Catenaria anguillulae PL171]
MMWHLGGKHYEFRMAVPINTPWLDAVAKHRKAPFLRPQDQTELWPEIPDMPATLSDSEIGDQGTGKSPRTALQSPANLDTLQVGGMASVDPGARTLAVVYLPHLRSFVHFGVGLAQYAMDQWERVTRLPDHAGDIKSQLTLLHLERKKVVCEKLRIDTDEWLCRV